MPQKITNPLYFDNDRAGVCCTGRSCIQYVWSGLVALLFLIITTSLILSVAVIVDYEEIQTYQQHNCTNITNYQIEKWNMFCQRATANTIDTTSDQNITLFYPPIETWIPWRHSTARSWFNHLANLTEPFPCLINFPKRIGVSGLLSTINVYYFVCGISFILLLTCVCIGCRYKSLQARRHGYYAMN